MLLELVAVISSTALGVAVEVSVMPAASAVPAPATTIVVSAPAAPGTEQAAWSAALDVAPPYLGPNIGPVLTPGGGTETASRADVAQLRGMPLLTSLGGMTAEQLSIVLADNPDLVNAVMAAPPAASRVTTWWGSVPTDTRRVLIDEAPAMIGNLEGVPFPTRDRANRIHLNETVAELTAEQQTAGRAAQARSTSTLHMLEQVAAALESEPGEPRRSLLTLDATGAGTASVAVGSITTADYVTYLVPGMFFGVDARIDDWADTASRLLDEQSEWLEHFDRQDDTVAAVAWIGYQTPTLVNVASMELARDGRDALTSSLRGLTATRDSAPYLTVIAHSYGSSAAMLALQENDVTVDALALVGSPGSPAATIDELKVRDGNVFVGAAAWDPISWSGAFGSQPLDASYGAHRMTVTAGTDPLTGEQLTGAISHNDYFTEGSSSMRNFALIGIGEGTAVVDQPLDSAPIMRAVGRTAGGV